MAHRMEESDLLIHPVSSREAQTSLLSPIPELKGPRSLLKQLSCLPCNICVKSKAAMLILVWSIIIGAVYLSLLIGLAILGFALQNNIHGKHHTSLNILVCALIALYTILTLILMLYPLSGYVADVRFGRYKTVTFSFVLLWVAMLFISGAVIMGIKVNFHKFGELAVPSGLLIGISLLLMVMSLACYQANIIQLGLDQLLEAPSEKLGLFIHWLMWSYTLGSFITLMLFVPLPCYVNVRSVMKKLTYILACTPLIFFFILTLLLAFTCYNHNWFYSEPGQNNPYKTVYRVLNFARKNKYPLRRSAFTYCDDFRPSRIDFAKERYGGPFTTPQVEDVKTLLRIVTVLLALGPLFILEIPGSVMVFPLFALHTSKVFQFRSDSSCSSLAEWGLIQSSALGYIFSVLFLPVYMWVVYSLLQKRIPKILNRLTYAVVISMAGVLCLLITDLVGHFYYHHQPHLENSTNGTCLFTSPLQYSVDKKPTILSMHWGVNIPSCVLMSLGSLLVRATTFEFISAQSPHSMKGLLVGIFFAIKGLFQFIGVVTIFPFAIPRIWDHINAVTNCGFGYYLFTIVVALIGLVVFLVVVRRYKYRQRDERPYDPRFAEQYYERYIGMGSKYAVAMLSPSYEGASGGERNLSSSDETCTVNSSGRDYRTFQ